MLTQKSVNELAYEIVGCAIEVQKHLGPGLLESVYEKCFKYELELNGFRVEKQKNVNLSYKSLKFESVLKIDLLVNDTIVFEIKSVESITAIHKAQLLTYLKG